MAGADKSRARVAMRAGGCEDEGMALALKPPSALRRLAAWLEINWSRARMLLAVKAAIAVGIAWFIAPYMPGVVDDYPYYAPLGALVSMYPTLMGSVKVGLQTLAGLLIGVVLAGVVVVLAEPNLVTIPLVVGVAVLVSGIGILGHGKDYVPVAALFVLILGGQEADDYSIGYAAQMAVGVACGLLVNILVWPPLNFSAAVLQLSRFRTMLAAHLEGLADALTEDWPPERDAWTRYNSEIATAGREVREAVYHADESHKGNPRARRYGRDLGKDYRDLRSLETVAFHVRDITDVLAGAGGLKPLSKELPEGLLVPIAEALLAAADSLRAWESGEEGRSERLQSADGRLDGLLQEVEAHSDAGATALSPAASVATAVRRILETVSTSIQAEDEEAQKDTGRGPRI
jgi:uncharacterized membrane protein YccC